ncbi:hypothetical protein Glove_227g98 [Diversispora epigaea]|uniref:Uncharacterized protein n=1 Tax=Diversispora epigaea TaxID=1348612 RepID=A0A397IEG1_9GLOM|nr:hypothetical protein Glove_227g98 [Diversispora epigaea]
MSPKRLKPRFKSLGLPIKINNDLLNKQMRKLRVSNNASINASNYAAAPSISRASKMNNSQQTLPNDKDDKDDINDIIMTDSSTMATKNSKNSSLKNNNTPLKTNANSNKLKKARKSVQFSLPDESQSNERSEAFNEKVKEERRKLKMNKELQLQHAMSAMNVNDTVQETALEWKGSLVKADPIQNIATVIMKPFPGRCNNLVKFNEIKEKNKDYLWMKDHIKLPYALELINEQESLFIINPVKKPLTLRNVNAEYVYMKENDIVGIIWLNDENTSCWLVFPTNDKIVERLKLSKRPKVPYILYEKTLPCNIMRNIITDKETIQNVSLNWNVETFIYIYNCHDILEIFKNPGIKYMDFSPDPNDCFEVKDMRNTIQYLGAILCEDYNDEIELVLASTIFLHCYIIIHYLFGKQVLFIPNLINLKRLPNCKFFEYGTNPKSQNSFTLEEYFPQGGYVTATTAVLINEQDAIDRIFAIMNYQSYKHNGAKWELVLNENILEYLAYVATNSTEHNQYYAKIAYLDLIMHAKANKIRYFSSREIFKTNLKTTEPPTMLLSTHRTMIRVHTMNWKKCRHFILIYDSSEDLSMRVPIDGVELLTLEGFESQFGEKT